MRFCEQSSRRTAETMVDIAVMYGAKRAQLRYVHKWTAQMQTFIL